MAGEQLTPFGAPTQRPDEPVTAGIDMGAGPGSDALMVSDRRLNLISALDDDGTPDALLLRDIAMMRGWI